MSAVKYMDKATLRINYEELQLHLTRVNQQRERLRYALEEILESDALSECAQLFRDNTECKDDQRAALYESLERKARKLLEEL